MSVMPTTTDLSRTAGRIVVFNSWLWQAGATIAMDVYTNSIEGKGTCLLPWGVWKLRNLGPGPGGMGVQAELYYDGTGVSAAVLNFIQNIFWKPPSQVQIQFTYSKDGMVRELIAVNLV